uniref:MICOS complex subunit MIC19 n=1 Tax=Polytomella parva TaxID=51329 RepID=A0A7S0US24_9CHLO|mmetsp:Transcript_19463/g.35120  ORF Transcript_19463/g.35120 Transcript_19463/m.35120 type:complete len:152 (+) Transcript_19463:95-550(+)|eukprot:CAMPEP_0175084182 /NCGR_PEP_ID=MMETSP0052_2-20121109/27895_1 /TAXON_ID=51329 ORGANISM="Polytomella parva, Strain SAG 63-3" /NCGR_SAMPLE_ID=MMETSP0052_2 /ASSEMBLY_ACC=CAM_ASM_000194 /LENGTH=151 /DNA_ID=CAMNT_0016355913 /DNA_START=69 /DNA_END=524 /DNA_ORIENTATION=+
MGQAPRITFTVGLIEKVAGIKKEEPEKAVVPPVSALPGAPLPNALRSQSLSPDATRLINQDARLSRQLHAAREVNGLLIRNEAEEADKIKLHAEKLVKNVSVSLRPFNCEAERKACTECFASSQLDASKCLSAAEAYRACSNKSFASVAVQ